MATVYKGKISVVSPWTSFDAKTIEKAIKKALEGLEVGDNFDKLESVEIKIDRL